MYRLSGRQILVLALGSALFTAVAVLGFQRLSGHFQPLESRLSSRCIHPVDNHCA